MNTRVGQLLNATAINRIRAAADSTVLQVLHQLREGGSDCAAIVEAGRPRGVVSLRDLDRCERCVEASCRPLDELSADQVMDRAAIATCLDEPIGSLLCRMVSHQARFAIVFDQNDYRGLLTLAEIAARASTDLSEQIEHLEGYIFGLGGEDDSSALPSTRRGNAAR